MTASNGWPDPARAGVPLNPEVDGWHWLGSFNGEKTIVFWQGENQGNEGYWEGYPLWIAQAWVYLGPVLSHDEATALQKRVAELEGVLREMVYEATHLSPQNIDGSRWCKISKDALEKARATAQREGKMGDDPWLTVIDQVDIEAAIRRKKSRDERLVEQEVEITRLRAELATARRDALVEIKQDTDELIEQGRQDGMEQAAQIGDRHIEVGKVLAETEADKRLADDVKMQVGAMQQVVDAIRAAAQEGKP